MKVLDNRITENYGLVAFLNFSFQGSEKASARKVKGLRIETNCDFCI